MSDREDRPATADPVRRYVLAVSLAGAASLAGLVLATWPVTATAGGPDLLLGMDPARLGVLFGLSVLSVWVPLRYHHGAAVQGFNLEGAVLLALLFTTPLPVGPVVTTLAAAFAYGSKTRSPVKTAFNAGHVALTGVVAAAVFLLLRGEGPILSIGAVGVTAVTAAVMVAANALLMAELFHRLEGRARREVLGSVAHLHLATLVGNASAGYVLAILAELSPWATLPAGVFLVGLYLGYRGFAGVLEDRRRGEQLHAVTRTLVEVSPTAGALGAFGAFGAALRELLGASAAEIVVLEPRRRVLTVSAAGVTESDEPSAEGNQTLRLSLPVRSAETRDGRRAALAAPLIHSGTTVGAIAVFDRQGLEPWDDTDLTLLATVANEAAVAVKNIELFGKLERERARLEAESTKLGDIVNAASDGIALIDREGRIRAWNAALADITGVTEEHTLGQPWFVPLRVRDGSGRDVLPGDDSPITAALAGSHRRDALSLQVLRRDGQWRVLRATFAPVLREDAEPIGTVVVARDITGEREVEGLKADFVATVSHELRTPLTPLKGFITTLQHRGTAMEEDQLRAVFEAMAAQVSRLENLISDLLVVADLDRGTVTLRGEPLDLGLLVRAAVEEEQRDDRVSVEGGSGAPHVVGDAAAVIRVVRALVSNALKHTEGSVTVSIGTERGDGVVRVTDAGPGIPPWEQKQVFQRFHRLGDHLTRTQGPGLGLPIARALADRMSGSLELTSDVGTGSEFTLRLPLARPHRLDHPAAARGRLAGA